MGLGSTSKTAKFEGFVEKCEGCLMFIRVNSNYTDVIFPSYLTFVAGPELYRKKLAWTSYSWWRLMEKTMVSRTFSQQNSWLELTGRFREITGMRLGGCERVDLVPVHGIHLIGSGCSTLQAGRAASHCDRCASTNGRMWGLGTGMFIHFWFSDVLLDRIVLYNLGNWKRNNVGHQPKLSHLCFSSGFVLAVMVVFQGSPPFRCLEALEGYLSASLFWCY